MKAIITQYHGPTYSKGSRIRAFDLDNNSVTVSVDPALNSDSNHEAAKDALLRKMKWEGAMVSGEIRHNGRLATVWVFVNGFKGRATA